MGNFGEAVAISGNYAILGSHETDTAFIFERNNENWSEVAKLEGGRSFGISVSIHGNFAAVGAPNEGSTGEVFTYKREATGWVRKSILTPSDIRNAENFGQSVAVSEDFLIVGDPDSGAGSFYIYKRDGDFWREGTKYIPTGAQINDRVGISVAISDNYAIVGAEWDDEKGAESGAAYVYKRQGAFWQFQYKLTASDGKEFDEFGSSVSVSGNKAMVGAKNNAVYIYELEESNTISLDAIRIDASDISEGDWFGLSVVHDGNYALVGAFIDEKGENSGAAYVFKREGDIWIEQTKLIPQDGSTGDEFGNSISLDGDYALVGAWKESDNNDEIGAAYIFKREGSIWIEQAKLTASDRDVGDRLGIEFFSEESMQSLALNLMTIMGIIQGLRTFLNEREKPGRNKQN